MSEIQRLMDLEVVFRQQNAPLPADVRLEWRAPLLFLVVEACHGAKASWPQLHLLNWALKSDQNLDAVRAAIGNGVSEHEVVVRYEPALARLVDFVAGARYVTWAGGRLALAEPATTLLREVRRNDLFHGERMFLTEIGKITRKTAEVLLGGRREV